MATDVEDPRRELTPTAPVPSTLPQKRAHEDDHSPAVSSPLNPEVKFAKLPAQQEDTPAVAREKRTKKESLKKRESKGAAAGASGVDSSRATPDPKQRDPPPGEVAPMRYKLAPPKPSDFEPARGPVFASRHEVEGLQHESIDFYETLDHVYNKKNFHYSHCIADRDFPSSFYYRGTEPEPHCPHLCFEDAATHMYFDKQGSQITTDKGFRMCRANVAVREGRWYWECKITRGPPAKHGDAAAAAAPARGHVRMGWARREASLDAPVGFDAYSYGLRDVAGQKVHMSRPKDFFPPGEDVCEGDVIGLEIQLPSERLHRKVVLGQYNPAVDLDNGDDDDDAAAEAPNIVRDRIPIRFKAHIYFEQIDYHTTKELDELMNPSPISSSGPAEPPNPNHPSPCLRTLPGSHIKIYKNGVLMGTPWTSLLAFLPPASRPLQPQQGARDGLDDGMLGYFPALSVFRGGAAEVNFGPNFWFPPPELGDKEADPDTQMKDTAEETAQATTTTTTADNGGGPKPAAATRLSRLRPVAERYDEQIVEDIVYDVIDEVTFWLQDGAKDVDRSERDGKTEVAVVAPGREEEIKEIVQDD